MQLAIDGLQLSVRMTFLLGIPVGSRSDADGLSRMLRDYDVSEIESKVIPMENNHVWYKGHFVHPYIKKT